MREQPPGFRPALKLRRIIGAFQAAHEGATMFSAYLLKTEASVYSWDDLKRDVATEWDGVSNPTAVKHLREMQPGSKLIIYETGDVRSAVGTATVVSVDAADPKKPIVKIKAGKAIAKPVTLDTIKKQKLFASSPLVKIGRLSVVPLTKEQYDFLAGA
jgi:predicted RNA-binding protein with PUA-like domain